MAAALDPQKLKTRLVSGALFAPPCLFAAYMGGFWLLAMIVILMSLAIWEWWKLCRHLKTDAEHTIFWGGMVYMGLSAYAFHMLGTPAWDHGAFTILVMVIGSDVGAYFAGKKFGGPKMFPAISPNKTWAGLGGAMAGAAFIAFLCWLLGIHIQHIGFVPVAGIVIGLAGQAGDLLESWVKRLAGVKDTGGFLPGHGGILDRIDSLVMAVPVFMLLSGLSG